MMKSMPVKHILRAKRFRFLLGLAPIVVGDDSVSSKLADLVAVAERTLVGRLMSCLVEIGRSTPHGGLNFVASEAARMWRILSPL